MEPASQATVWDFVLGKGSFGEPNNDIHPVSNQMDIGQQEN